MRSAAQEDFKFTVASIDNLEPIYSRHSVRQLSLTGRKFEVELFKDDHTAAEDTFSFCCAHGQVQAGRTPQPPTLLDDLLTPQTQAANRLNNASTMASTGSKVRHRTVRRVTSFTECCR